MQIPIIRSFPAIRPWGKHRLRDVLCRGLVLLVLVPGVAWSEDSAVSEEASSFLSDPGPTGALVGGVLAGAAFANPFAPLAGTVVGFFVGKSTDYSGSDDDQQGAAIARSIVPEDSGAPVAQLDLSGGDAAPVQELSTVSEPLPEDSVPMPVVVAEVPASDHEGHQHEEAEETVVAQEAVVAQESSIAEPAPDAGYEPIHLIMTKDVGGTQARLDELAAIIRQEQQRPEFVPNERCPNDRAPNYRKKVAVAGFVVEDPEQRVFGRLGDVGEAVSKLLYQQLLSDGKVQPYAAPNRQMFASIGSAPTWSQSDNRLRDVSAVSRQMGVQFVISGVIRQVGVQDENAWDNSVYSRTRRALFSSDTTRDFVVDVIVHDGYTGRVVIEKRYQTSGRWDLPLSAQAEFGSAAFMATEYGQAVQEQLAAIAEDVVDKLACQPMLIPILEVNGKDLLLDVGTKSGLLPGDRMELVRSESSLAYTDAPPQLWETGVELHIHTMSLDTSRAWMHQGGSRINIQRGDYALIY